MSSSPDADFFGDLVGWSEGSGLGWVALGCLGLGYVTTELERCVLANRGFIYCQVIAKAFREFLHYYYSLFPIGRSSREM